MLTPIARAARLLTRVFTRTPDAFTPPRRDPLRFRPRLEGFEDRLVPTALTWISQTVGFTDGNGNYGLTPDGDDDIYFDGRVSNANAVGGGNSYLLVHSINLVGGYSGTVTATSEIRAQNFILESGAVSAGASGSDLTVYNSFVWTGGVLNSSSIQGTLHLAGGATATIDPGVGNTLSTGSNISFENDGNGLGSTGTFSAGTINLLNNATLTAAVDTSMTVDGTEFVNAAAAPAAFELNGAVIFGAGGAKIPSPVHNTGSFNITNGGTVDIQFGDANNWSYYQTGGTGLTQIESGSKLKVKSNAVFAAGSGALTTLKKAGAGVQTATIEGDLDNYGADVMIGSGSTPHSFGTLIVTGKVYWAGGTYRPNIDASNPGTSDLWKALGTFTVGGTAAMAPGAVNTGGGIPANQVWLVMQGNGILGVPLVPAGGWCTITTGGMPVDKWFVST